MQFTTRIFTTKIQVVNLVEFTTQIFTRKIQVVNLVEFTNQRSHDRSLATERSNGRHNSREGKDISYWLLELVSSLFMETESVKNGKRNAFFFRFWSSSVVEVLKSP